MLAKYSGECPRCGRAYGVGTPIVSRNGRWYPETCPTCQKRDLDVPTRLAELLKLLNLDVHTGPQYTGQHLFTLDCGCEFEPHGRHESWGLDWRITLPTYLACYKTTSGWKRCTVDTPMSFSAATVYEAIDNAIAFVQYVQEHEELLVAWNTEHPERSAGDGSSQ